jgi:hypothetical protein
MPDPEPSDASDFRAVNRIARVTETGYHEAVGFPSHIEDRVGPGGYVVNIDQPEATKDIVPELTRAHLADLGLSTLDRGLSSFGREAFYVCFYKFVREAVSSGKTPKEIEAAFLSHMASIGELADVAREAVEDALANRPMRYEDPYDE